MDIYCGIIAKKYFKPITSQPGNSGIICFYNFADIFNHSSKLLGCE
jgi:hypothetical protein